MSLSSVSAWDRPDTVAAFSRSAPNPQLIDYARRRPVPATRVLDIGCGAGRNAVPLAADGFEVIGLDRSRAMLVASAARSGGGRVRVIEAAMDHLPIRSRSIDLVVAHGIWNLARSDREWRDAVNEASRVAAPGARLFVFTFSRHTLADTIAPVDGEQYVFTEFSGSPQVFVTEAQLVDALQRAGFAPDPDLPMRELNVTPPGQLRTSGAPVIYEGGFVFQGV